MLFNDADSLAYEDIQAATDIPEEDLKRVLQSLACVKVRRGGGGWERERGRCRRRGAGRAMRGAAPFCPGAAECAGGRPPGYGDVLC